MSLHAGGGAKLTLDAGDGSSTACADIGGGTTMYFIGVSRSLAGNKNKFSLVTLYCYSSWPWLIIDEFSPNRNERVNLVMVVRLYFS